MIKSQYFRELTPQIKNKFLEEILCNEIKFFGSLFRNDGEYAMNIQIITQLMVNIESQIYETGQFLIQRGDEVKNFYLIKQGEV